MKTRVVVRFLLLFLLVSALSSCRSGAKHGVGGAPDFTVTDLQGKKLSLSDYRGKVVLLDFWATWCAPCLEEIPYFQEAVEKNKQSGIKLLLVSLDLQEAYPDAIASTILKRNIKAPVRWLDETNADYFCPYIDKSWSGGMPASLFVNNKTVYRKFFEEKLPEEKLYQQLDSLLAR